jgi:hypothetical protein
METGYIKLSRSILDWKYYKDANVFKVFMHLLLHASFCDRETEYCDIKRGQVIVSVDNMDDKLGLSKKQIRLALNKLASYGSIVVKGTNRFTLVTICNYDKYQCQPTTEGQTKGNQMANESQTKDNQRATYKEGNKERIKELKNSSSVSTYTREDFCNDLLGDFKTDANLREVTMMWLKRKKVITKQSMEISKKEIAGHTVAEMYTAIMSAAEKNWAQLYGRKEKQAKGTSTSLPAGKPWLDPATIAAAERSAKRLEALANPSPDMPF